MVASKELQGDKPCPLVGWKLPQRTWQREMTSFTASPAKSKQKTEGINESHNPVSQRGTGSQGAWAELLPRICDLPVGAAPALRDTSRSHPAAAPFNLMGTGCLQRVLVQEAGEGVKQELSCKYIIVRLMGTLLEGKCGVSGSGSAVPAVPGGRFCCPLS